LWLRQYITDNLLSAFFGIFNFALNRIIKRTLVVLDQSLPDVTWPTDDELNELCVKFRHIGPDDFANFIVVVDGTEIPIRRPKDIEIQKQFYSTKKKQYSVTILLIVSLDGRILYFLNPQIGSSDQHHWNCLQLRQLFVNKPYGIIGDAGFTFNPLRSSQNGNELEIMGATRKKRSPHGELSDEDKHHNQILSSLRAVVENVIAQIKNWKIFSGIFRHFSPSRNNQIDFDLVVIVVTKIVAQQLQHRPLRHKGWQILIKNRTDGCLGNENENPNVHK
jgi:hypothetical protein